jgi:hypothetical protein
MRICSRTMSTPVISSVMVCSTCTRVFISMKYMFAIFGEQELHGTGVLVAHGLRRAHRQIADIGALLGGQLRAGGDLDQLLVAPLDRAVALEQVHHVAEAVAEDLHLDVRD